MKVLEEGSIDAFAAIHTSCFPATSYLFDEFYRQGVLTSDFFLNEKRFLHGIDGEPDPEMMEGFDTAIRSGRELANQRLKQNPEDPEALYALTLAAGMESDADMILRKHNLDVLRELKEANAYAKVLLAERPDTKDVYVALGSANYIIGSLEGGRYLQPFAKIMLALAARREKQNALAQKLLHELTEEFPESRLYPAEYAKAMGRPIPATMHP